MDDDGRCLTWGCPLPYVAFPHRTFRKVDFPHPLPPMTATSSEFANSPVHTGMQWVWRFRSRKRCEDNLKATSAHRSSYAHGYPHHLPEDNKSNGGDATCDTVQDLCAARKN